MREIDRTLSTDEAAKMLGISRESMKMRAYRGTVPTTRKGNYYRYKLTDIIDILDREDDGRPLVPFKTGGQVITLPEVAAILRVTTMALHYRKNRGERPQPIEKVKGKWQYDLAEVMAVRSDWEATGRLKPIQETGKKQKALPAKFDANYGIEFETIKAICPACREPHETLVVKGSTKWIYCPRHACYRNASISKFAPNNVNLPPVVAY